MHSPLDGNQALRLALARPESMTERTPAEWTVLVAAARETSLLGTLWNLATLAGVAERLPEPVGRHLYGGFLKADRNAEAIQWELQTLQSGMLQRLDPPVVLKGGAYLLAGLPNASGRICNDVDLLFPRADLERAESLLFFEGWGTTHHDPYDQRYYREWMHELPPLEHWRRGTTLDVHHNILPETFAVRTDPVRLLASACDLPAPWRYRVLRPAHLALHAIVHLFSETEWDRALRDLYDIKVLLEHFGGRGGDSFWRDLVDEASSLGVTWLAAYALDCCEQSLHAGVPLEVREALLGSRITTLKRRAARPLFLHGLNTRASATPKRDSVARALLFLRGHWLKMPPRLLARHLFYKAFLAPKEDVTNSRTDPAGGGVR